MTSNPVQRPLKIDRLELSYRFEPANFWPIGHIRAMLEDAIADSSARRVGVRRYPNSESPSERVAISLRVRPRRVLVVETGIVEDRNGDTRPYAKFEFNVQGLLVDESSRASFLLAMSDLLPGGGYRELCENGYVLYAEFAADFIGVDVAGLDAFSEEVEIGRWFPGSAQRETLSLGRESGVREYSFTIYNKTKQEREVEHRIRRRQITRIEAKRRFNHTKTYRKIRLGELASIENPFMTLRIYEAEKFQEVLAAARHQRFLDVAARDGVQNAFLGTRGDDRRRRLNLLEECRVQWWAPETVWGDGIDNAVREALELEQ